MAKAPTKKYKPQYIQLPYGFLADDDNYGLRQLIRENGLWPLSVYTIILESMGGYADKGFTMSYEEMSIALREKGCMVNDPKETIDGYLLPLIEAGVISKIWFWDCDLEIEEQRYAIRGAVPPAAAAYDAWLSKCINPRKCTPEEKAQLKAYREAINKAKSEVNRIYRREDHFNALIDQELAKAPTVMDQEAVRLWRAELATDKERKKEFLRTIKSNEANINRLITLKGDISDDFD